MHPDFSARANGKTTRVLLSIANAMSEGHRVLLVVPSMVVGREMLDQLERVLNSVNGQPSKVRWESELYCWRGSVTIACASALRIKGQTFTKLFVDGGVLTNDEKMEIYPRIIDVNHFETGYDEHTQDLFESTEENRAPRTLSSRS